ALPRLLIVLQELEPWLGLVIEYDDFAIEDCLVAQFSELLNDGSIPFVKRKLVSGIEADQSLTDLRDPAITVPFDFEQPTGAVKRLVDRGCKHRPDAGR